MKNYFIELVKDKKLSEQTITIYLKSGKSEEFSLKTDTFNLCTGYNWIIFIKDNVQYVIDCSNIEMITIA